MILGEYLQMKYGTQKKKLLIMQREINLKNLLAFKSILIKKNKKGVSKINFDPVKNIKKRFIL